MKMKRAIENRTGFSAPRSYKSMIKQSEEHKSKMLDGWKKYLNNLDKQVKGQLSPSKAFWERFITECVQIALAQHCHELRKKLVRVENGDLAIDEIISDTNRIQNQPFAEATKELIKEIING